MNKRKLEADFNNESIFQKLTFKYLPYWYLFLALFLVSMALAYTFIKVTPPAYETSASILVKDEKKGQEDSKMEEVLNVFNTTKIVENEVEILRSRAVIKSVVEEQQLTTPVTIKTGWRNMVARSGFHGAPVRVEARNPEALVSSKVPIPFTLDNTGKRIGFEGKSYALNEWITSAWGEIRFTENPYFDLSKTKLEQGDKPSYFVSINTLKSEIDRISQDLVANPTSKQSSVITMKIKDEVPKRAENILSGLIKGYNLAYIRKKNETAAKTLEFIDERLKVVSRELDSVERSIQQFRNQTGAVDISEQSRIYLQSMEENDKKRNEVNMQLAVLNDVEKYVASNEGSGNIVPSTQYIEDPSLTGLLNNLRNTESQYEKLRTTTAENNPVLLNLKADITKTRQNILENVRNQKSSLSTSKSSLDRVSGRYESMIRSIPQQERQLVDVSRQRNIKSDIYSFLLQKREETQYSINSTIADSHMVDAPSSGKKPISPNKPLIALLAGIVPFVLGFAFVTVKDMLNTKVLYRNEIEQASKFQIIGEVIYEKSASPLTMFDNARNFMVEQFRQIRSSVKNISSKHGATKRIIVTSSISGEGKTFIATNLAISFSRSGKKVVLLEMDLHMPKAVELLNLERGIGITDYLKSEADETSIIHELEQTKNLSVISAGNLDPEASELLLNGRIEKLLAYLDQHFDLIIIDMPPISAISDYYSMEPNADMTIYVVRHAVTPKVHLNQIDENMEAYGIERVNIIFNGIRKRGRGKFAYGYGYGYGYDFKTNYDAYHKKGKKSAA